MTGSDGSPGQRWAGFYLKHRQGLATYALSLTGDAHEAEDLIQEVLMRMVQENRRIERAKGYVLRCMRNLIIDRHRCSERRPESGSLESVNLGFIDARLGEAERQESAERVRQALSSLPPSQSEVIVLKIYCDLTFKEIATMLGQPMGTVTSHYARGLDRLRKTCEEEFDHV